MANNLTPSQINQKLVAPAESKELTQDDSSQVNTDIVINIPGDPKIGQRLYGISYRYDKEPTGGRLTVIDWIPTINRKVTIYKKDISSAGSDFVSFDPPKDITIDNVYIITLKAGGDGVTGQLDVKIYEYPYQVSR